MRPALKRLTFLRVIIFVGFFILITLYKKYFSLSYWPFWVGGLIGTFLPDVDHLIYIYFIAPQDLTSQRASSMVNARNIKGTVELLADTKHEREILVFHKILFQLIFLAVSFLVITSSGSVFGKGLVVAFNVHLLVDQFRDLTEEQNIQRWFRNVPFTLDKRQMRTYIFFVFLVVLIFTFLL